MQQTLLTAYVAQSGSSGFVIVPSLLHVKVRASPALLQVTLFPIQEEFVEPITAKPFSLSVVGFGTGS